MSKAVLLLLLLLGACASVPMASPSDDAAGKRFDSPPAGMAALYVYRADTIGGFRTVEVTAGQRLLGDLASNTWLRVDLSPGAYDVRCKFESPAIKAVTLTQGETRYIEVGFGIGRCLLTEVAADAAKPFIISGSRAATIR